MTDYHLHSNFSNDSDTTMEEMAKAEIKRGIEYICFTDHAEDCNDGEPISYETSSFLEVSDDYFKSIAEVRAQFRGVLDIAAGIEVSGINHDPEKAAQLASIDGLDFIIGSVHNNRGKEDFYGYEYRDLEECYDLFEDYLRENRELVKCGCCDIVGHIGYPLNNMFEYGFDIKLSDRFELLRELLRDVIQSGIGIELNTSGLRKKINRTAPDPDTVRLYRELGGEIITVGSDGHDASRAGVGIDRGFEILRDAGFKYVAVFRNRKPQFIKI